MAPPDESFAGHVATQGIGGGEPIGLGSIDLAAALEVVAAAARSGPGGDGSGPALVARRLRELGIARLTARVEHTASGIRGRIHW